MMEVFKCLDCGEIYYSTFDHDCPKNSDNIVYESYLKILNSEDFIAKLEKNQNSKSSLNSEDHRRIIQIRNFLETETANSFQRLGIITSVDTPPIISRCDSNPLDPSISLSLDEVQSLVNTIDEGTLNSNIFPDQTFEGDFCQTDYNDLNPSIHVSSQNDSKWCDLTLVPETKLKNVYFGEDLSTSKKVNSIEKHCGERCQPTSKEREGNKALEKINYRSVSGQFLRFDDCSREEISSNAEHLSTLSKPEAHQFAEPSGINTRSIGNGEEVRFLCEVCCEGFSRKDYFLEHLRTHTGDKPYVCGYCWDIFRQNSYLQNHVRSHTGQKPYQCGSICGREFARQSILEDLLRIHTGETFQM